MRNFSSFVSWSLFFIISLYILRTFADPASVNVGQPEGLPEDHDEENKIEPESPMSTLHYFIFGGEPDPHKEGHSDDKSDESCDKNQTKIDDSKSGIAEESDGDGEAHVESVDPTEGEHHQDDHATVKVARQAVAPPPPQDQQNNQQNNNNLNLKGPAYTVVNDKNQQINNNNGQGDSLPKSKNPLDAILEISDPGMRNVLTAFYGSLTGDADCGKKTTCLLGNAFEGFPGRDYFFMFAGRYVPSDWAVLYDIFRISSLYGQNCDLYLCQPKPKQGQQSIPSQ